MTSAIRKRALDPILLLGSIIALAAVLTWVLPAGRYERAHDARTGRTTVVPDSYRLAARNPVGPWDAVMAIPQGLMEAADIVFYVLLAGAALTVVEGTGAIGNLLNHAIHRFAKRPAIVLGLASALFLIGGAAESMYEEILAFVPLLCALMRQMGLENEMALGVSVGMASVAGAFSPFNTFLLGISQPVAELPLFSGFGFRTVVFVLAIAIWGGYLAWYASRTRGKAEDGNRAVEVTAAPERKWTARDIWVLIVVNAGMAAIVTGGIAWGWEMRQFSAIFVVIGVVAGLVGGLGWRGTSEQFAEGLRRMALAATLIGFARSISVILKNGQVLDTIASVLFSPLHHVPVSFSGVMMLVSQSVLTFPMPSDSGRAMVSLPVLIPLGDLLGLSRQMVVVAYQYASFVSGMLTPTAGALLAMLAMSGLTFGRWVRFIALPSALLFVLSAATMVAGVYLGIR